MVLPPPSVSRRLLQPFAGKTLTPPPVWLMRQAGRHLPEYHEVRAKAGSFLDLCYTPDLAAEVTLQPVRRYGLDAAIVFSDILVIPHALGQKVEFVEGMGPLLDPVRSSQDLAGLQPSATRAKLDLVYEVVAKVRQRLPDEIALIGFCGAPWTVATYMVGGGGRAGDREAAEHWARADAAGFGALIERLVDASVEYLSGQIAAGADVLQIFDTWAGRLSGDAFQRWIIEPTKAIVAGVKAAPSPGSRHRVSNGCRSRHPGLCGAMRGGRRELRTLQCPSTSSRVSFPVSVVVQGNLDPQLVLAGGLEMERRAMRILAALSGKPFIFNLGHGVLPQTPPQHVARLVKLIREGK